jgi:hypothetical protein
LGLFAAAFVCGWVTSAFVGPLLATSGQTSSGSRPTLHPYAAFTVRILEIGHAPREATITTDEDCNALSASQKLFDICSLAINADPAVIGGAAFGRLNFEHTVAFEALVWRARINGDLQVCARGGLQGTWLERCQAAAKDPQFRARDQDVELIVPR